MCHTENCYSSKHSLENATEQTPSDTVGFVGFGFFDPETFVRVYVGFAGEEIGIGGNNKFRSLRELPEDDKSKVQGNAHLVAGVSYLA